MENTKLFLVLVLIGIACQNGLGAKNKPARDKSYENTMNDFRIEHAEFSWSGLAIKLTEELIPKFDRLSDRLDNMEQQITVLAMASKDNKDKAKYKETIIISQKKHIKKMSA